MEKADSPHRPWYVMCFAFWNGWIERMAKLRVGIVFGGKSAEHEVSLQSAKNIVEAIDKTRFDVVLLGIDKQGQWHISDAQNYLLNAQDPARIALRPSTTTLAHIPGRERQQMIDAESGQPLDAIDVIFPIVHGTLGEDHVNGCYVWQTCRLSAPTFWAQPPAWIKTSPSVCCAMPGCLLRRLLP